MSKHLVFLLEERSAKELLEGVLPNLVPSEVDRYFLTFEGKQDLEKHLVRKLRGWKRPDALFVVLRDQDAADCYDVKARLVARVKESQRSPVLVRVACKEIESWVLGDLDAVANAFSRSNVAKAANRKKYRNPDNIVRPVETLRKLVPEYQKCDGARRVAPLLDPERNQSASFRAFCAGVQRLVE